MERNSGTLLRQQEKEEIQCVIQGQEELQEQITSRCFNLMWQLDFLSDRQGREMLDIDTRGNCQTLLRSGNAIGVSSRSVSKREVHKCLIQLLSSQELGRPFSLGFISTPPWDSHTLPLPPKIPSCKCMVALLSSSSSLPESILCKCLPKL